MIFARRQGGPFVALALILMAGCATGQRDLNARDYWPSGSRWKHAASRAVKDRGTWIPLAGAAVVSIDGWDEQISDWAIEKTPVFGSNETAVDASDTLWLANQALSEPASESITTGGGPVIAIAISSKTLSMHHQPIPHSIAIAVAS